MAMNQPTHKEPVLQGPVLAALERDHCTQLLEETYGALQGGDRCMDLGGDCQPNHWLSHQGMDLGITGWIWGFASKGKGDV